MVACPYCNYEEPRPWERVSHMLCRCYECHRHYVPYGYEPTAEEASLLATEAADCERADWIADHTDILQTVAAEYPSALRYAICEFKNGYVWLSSINNNRLVTQYEPFETMAGNMRLCLRCMEYVQRQESWTRFELGDGFFAEASDR